MANNQQQKYNAKIFKDFLLVKAISILKRLFNGI